MDDRPALDFEAAWDVASTIPGWLTEEQARLLFDAARDLPAAPLLARDRQPPGQVDGRPGDRRAGARAAASSRSTRSSTAGSSAAPPPATKFEGNLREADLTDAVELLPEYSTRARPTWSRDLDYLYIDGKHDYWTLRDDLKWARHLPRRSAVLVHDCYSSIGVTLGVLANVLPSRTLRYERRAGLAGPVPGGHADRGRTGCGSCARSRGGCATSPSRCCCGCGCAPWPPALFGHESPYDPY